jgi:hypothetical protein
MLTASYVKIGKKATEREVKDKIQSLNIQVDNLWLVTARIIGCALEGY